MGASVNEEPAQELHKPVIKKSKRRKFYAKFKENIWAADSAEMRWVSYENRGVKYLLCVINNFTKFALVKPLKDTKVKTVLNGFIKMVSESNRKPKMLSVDQEREFYSSHMLKWLIDNNILMCSADNEYESVVAERFNKSFKR